MRGLVGRDGAPKPWSEGDNIPWNDPPFSGRMLKEHLRQDHDLASRALDKVDAHVAWIHETLLRNRPAKVLDLGCGPGFYANRLAGLGHQCVGIDYSPASIPFGQSEAANQGLSVSYLLQDIRT
ncbi:MAG: class I SAM-dependent methyltransferase, partial [Chloroflexi bacterium]|nr:class I SAM-dependent methyltransferase [Chloroflexota bacterium]